MFLVICKFSGSTFAVPCPPKKNSGTKIKTGLQHWWCPSGGARSGFGSSNNSKLHKEEFIIDGHRRPPFPPPSMDYFLRKKQRFYTSGSAFEIRIHGHKWIRPDPDPHHWVKQVKTVKLPQSARVAVLQWSGSSSYVHRSGSMGILIRIYGHVDPDIWAY